MPGMCRYKRSKLICRTTLCQRTGGSRIRHQHLLVRTEDGSCLAHEMDATEHNEICIGLGSLLCEC